MSKNGVLGYKICVTIQSRFANQNILLFCLAKMNDYTLEAQCKKILHNSRVKKKHHTHKKKHLPDC